ncbi:squalene cyclase [Aspergillus unguis]
MSSQSISQVNKAIEAATAHALSLVHPDGHWCGELRSNVTITAEYIFLRQALGLDLTVDKPAYTRYILSEQKEDGSWGLAPSYAGDVSTTTEAYLALKILGVDTSLQEMRLARRFILEAGGIAKVRVFTRIFLAMFGLFPWSSTPEIPVELILLPDFSPINIYSFASWARGTIAPLLIICHHRPVYVLPNGKSSANDFLDELWVQPLLKNVPYSSTLKEMLFNGEITEAAFSLLDTALWTVNGLRTVPFLRAHARKKCIQWILDRQEHTGDWGGIFPPMHASVFAFVLEGFPLDSDCVRKGIQALEEFAWEDKLGGKRIQPCISPVWDTALMTIALCDCSLPDRRQLGQSIDWIDNKQLRDDPGDWRVNRPSLPGGGWSFEYQNTWYPDVDDTAAVILAHVKSDPGSVHSDRIMAAAQWIVGMQNADGGWAAFDVNNTKEWLNKIPFSDMDSLCDTSCADITGRILEAFGLMIKIADRAGESLHTCGLQQACMRGIHYLAATQEKDGSWFGRWGCNYIYGTSHALCGLAYFMHVHKVDNAVQGGLQWLKKKQRADGGWGESLLSYKNIDTNQESTPSQTGWALMALIAHLPCTDPAIERGIQYLISSQTDATWPESQPQTVPTDRIIPLRYWDDMPHVHDFCFDFTLCFEDVLDVAKLEVSLARLMEIGDWGQLGARLRRNRQGRLEYQIPEHYSPSRPAFHFTTTQYPIGIRDHPLGSFLPHQKAGKNENIYAPPAEFAAQARHPTAPSSPEDWIYSDIPQLHIHAVVFDDATLLTITHLHILFDGPSRGYFLHAWSSVLAGREQDVKPFVPFQDDPLAVLGTDRVQAEQYTLHEYLLGGLGLVLFFLRHILNMLWYRYEEHPVRLPGKAVRRLREAALADKPNTPNGFMSDGDIILSWATGALARALSLKPSSQITVMNVMNVASVVPTIATEAVNYMGNAFFYAYTLLKAEEVLDDITLTGVASRLRNSIVTHRTPSQVHAMAAYQRDSFMHVPLVLGPSDQQTLTCSNYHCVRYYEVDFSAAVVLSGLEKDTMGHLPGRPVYINDYCRYPLLKKSNGIRVMGRDGNGDWWVMVMARAGAWSVLREEVRMLGLN